MAIYLNSHARDFETPERVLISSLRPRFGGSAAVERVKLRSAMDGVGTEFGGRHELYEVNYAGSHGKSVAMPFSAPSHRVTRRWKGFAGVVCGYVRRADST